MQNINPQNIFRFFQSNGNGNHLFDTLKSEVKPIISEITSGKIDNLVKLLYRLFIYSVFGFVAKFIMKILKFS